MKHLKLFESFSTDIDSICKEFRITNWSVNPDGAVDVDGNVNLSYKGLIKIPIKFGKVSGNFRCQDNSITVLDGAPVEVGGDFICVGNKLITLEGAPKKVGGDFYCGYNKLITLEGVPILIGGSFDCYQTPIFEVYNLFPDYKSFMYSMDYGYLRGTDIVKSRFQESLEEAGIKLPESIPGYRYI